MIGQTLQHYRLDARLGEGGMGVVYRATDCRLGRTVAIKLLPPQVATDADRRRRFVQEARAASALNHPNIITIHDIVSGEGVEGLVMEFVPGQTLEQVLAPGPPDVSHALEFALQIGVALAAAHDAGIVHRDLKPANVMVTNNGMVKVLDFGLAKRCEVAPSTVPAPLSPSRVDAPTLPGTPFGDAVVTSPGSMLGTAAYMSPEQAEGRPVDARSDIFSFGAVLYELLAGRRAFPGDSLASTLSAVLRDEPRPLHEVAPQVPPALEEVVRRCLRKDRAERFAAMQEVVIALRGISRNSATAAGSTLAVLPFANRSSDPENEFLSDGIAEDLITALSRVKGLRVTARTSAFAFKGKSEDIRRIGQLLNVESVLEGSVRRSGRRLRITAQLVKVADGFQLWSERYDCEMKDVFDIQDDITRAIVSALRAQLGASSPSPTVERPTESSAAYELYLKGRYHWNQRGIGLLKGLHYFELALLEDSDYALAYTGLADSYNLLNYYGVLPPSEAMPKAKTAATKAVALDPTLADAHVSLAFYEQFCAWNFVGAEPLYRRALALDPNNVRGRYWYACLLSFAGRQDEALAESQEAARRDPFGCVARAVVGWTLYNARRYDEAAAELRKAIELGPRFVLSHWLLGLTHVAQGRRTEALTELELAAELFGRGAWALGALGFAQATFGERQAAEALLTELLERREHTYVSSHPLAMICVGLGEEEQALHWLEQAYEERGLWVGMLKVDPAFDRLRGAPRLAALLHQMGLDK